MPKLEKLVLEKKASKQNKTTIMVQGSKGFENFAFVEVDSEILERIRNARELYRRFNIEISFEFQLQDLVSEIIVDAKTIHEFN